jgi:hypothetical protein
LRSGALTVVQAPHLLAAAAAGHRAPLAAAARVEEEPVAAPPGAAPHPFQALVDASFAIASRGDGSFDRETLLGATIPQAAGWIGGTAIGVLAGAVFGDPETLGLDGIFLAF